MARKLDDTRANLERRAPLAGTLGLLLGFVVLAVIGVITVVIPEITDDGEDETDGAAASDGAPSEPAAAP